MVVSNSGEVHRLKQAVVFLNLYCSHMYIHNVGVAEPLATGQGVRGRRPVEMW